MPAKRRGLEPAETSEPKQRQSKLAKEHKITAAEETEIKEAFSLFADHIESEKEPILAIGDVRRAMIALGITPSTLELSEFKAILDPEDEGYTLYHRFVAICALKLHAQSRTSETHAKEVEDAFRLFTTVGQRGKEGEGRITLATLKKVALALKIEVDEEQLKDMIREANGGVGVGKGVNKQDFEAVLRRAGVWR